MSVHDAIERAVTRRRIGRDDHQAEVIRRADELFTAMEAARLDVPPDAVHSVGTSSEEHDVEPA